MKKSLVSLIFILLLIAFTFADKKITQITVDGKTFTIINYKLICDLGEDYNPKYRYRKIDFQEIILPGKDKKIIKTTTLCPGTEYESVNVKEYTFDKNGRSPQYEPIFPNSKKIEILTPTVDALRLRNMPDLKKGTFMRFLAKGEKLRVVRREKKESIGGISGEWCQVITEDYKIGWCFDGYLEPVDTK